MKKKQLKNTQKTQSIKKNMLFFLMALPGLIWFILFSYTPMFGIVLAFKRYRIYGSFFTSLHKSAWIGFENFKFLFSGPQIWQITRNTVGYGILFLVLVTILSVIIAICLSEILNKRAAKVYQTLIFLPYFLSIIVVGYLLYSFLNFDRGALNHLLLFFHLHAVHWYNTAKPWPYLLTGTVIWTGIGFNSLFYLAAIMGVNKNLYEAAAVDGAGKWQQIKNITIPGIRPMIIILSLLGLGGIMNSNFGIFYWLPMNSGATFATTNVLSTYVYRGLMVSGAIGMTTAAGLYISCVGIILIVLGNWFVKRKYPGQELF